MSAFKQFLASDIIISFSERPIKFMISLGLLFSTGSLIAAMLIFFKAIFHGYSVMGWASIMSAIFFSTGIILIVTGFVGIYVGRIFKEVKKRPLYIISDKIN